MWSFSPHHGHGSLRRNLEFPTPGKSWCVCVCAFLWEAHFWLALKGHPKQKTCWGVRILKRHTQIRVKDHDATRCATHRACKDDRRDAFGARAAERSSGSTSGPNDTGPAPDERKVETTSAQEIQKKTWRTYGCQTWTRKQLHPRHWAKGFRDDEVDLLQDPSFRLDRHRGRHRKEGQLRGTLDVDVGPAPKEKKKRTQHPGCQDVTERSSNSKNFRLTSCRKKPEMTCLPSCRLCL